MLLRVMLGMVLVGSAALGGTVDVKKLEGFCERYEARFGVPDLAVAVFSREGRVFTYGGEGGGYTIGSVSKPVTAAAVLRLVEEGRLGLDDLVVEVLGGDVAFEGAEAAVTVRHLLSHRSGLKRKDGNLPVEPGSVVRLSGEPGERFSYSNLNYALLGKVVEKVTGKAFGEAMEELVFVPLGMTGSTAVVGDVADKPAVAHHRSWFGVPLGSALEAPHPSRVPSGFVRCTLDDLVRFVEVHLRDGDGVIAPETIALGRTPADGKGWGYGMGWGTGDYRLEHRHHGHNGATGTSFTAAGYFPELGLGYVAMANVDLFAPGILDDGEVLEEGVRDAVVGREPEMGIPWGRLARAGLGLLALVTGIGLTKTLLRWGKRGFPLRWKTGKAGARKLVWEIGVPVAVWWFVLRSVKISLVGMVEMMPSIGWPALLMTAAGMVAAVVNGLAPEEKTEEGAVAS